MKKVLLFFISLCTFTTVHAGYNAAGVLPFSYNKYGTSIVLLGQERYEPKFLDSNKWSDFGGGKKRQDKGHKVLTAARELTEETIGLLGSYDYILEHIQNIQKSNTYKITNRQDDYTMYVTPTPFQQTLPQRFRKKRFEDKKLSSDQTEKVDLAWVPVRNIIETLRKADSVKNLYVTSSTGSSLLLREPLVRTLSILYKHNILNDLLSGRPRGITIKDKPYITYQTNMLKQQRPATPKKVKGPDKQLVAAPQKPKPAQKLQTGWWLRDTK